MAEVIVNDESAQPAELRGWRPDELEAVAACPACSSTNSAHLYDFTPDYFCSTPGLWSHRSCLACASIFLTPRPRADTIERAYRSYYTHRSPTDSADADNGTSLLWRLANGYMNARFDARRSPSSAAGASVVRLLVPLRMQLDYFFRHLPRTPIGDLLDIGCGNGEFLLRARGARWNVHGVDVDANAVASARAAGLDVRRQSIFEMPMDRQFEVVTASHVLEHVHDPNAFLHQCFRLLKPGGRLWLALPNPESIGSRLFCSYWFHLDPPRHLVLPTASALKRMLIEQGFRDPTFIRRGRGARVAVEVSASRLPASAALRRAKRWTWPLIDLFASLSRFKGEELVVIAHR